MRVLGLEIVGTLKRLEPLLGMLFQPCLAEMNAVRQLAFPSEVIRARAAKDIRVAIDDDARWTIRRGDGLLTTRLDYPMMSNSLRTVPLMLGFSRSYLVIVDCVGAPLGGGYGAGGLLGVRWMKSGAVLRAEADSGLVDGGHDEFFTWAAGWQRQSGRSRGPETRKGGRPARPGRLGAPVALLQRPPLPAAGKRIARSRCAARAPRAQAGKAELWQAAGHERPATVSAPSGFAREWG
jgi:hypothetical protein